MRLRPAAYLLNASFPLFSRYKILKKQFLIPNKLKKYLLNSSFC